MDRSQLGLKPVEMEIFALPGGSGCGKTTLLRMPAGFEMPSAGRILIDGQDTAGVAPWDRPMHRMFQTSALFAHMTVERNVGCGLKHDAMTDAQRRARVAPMPNLVQLTPFAGCKPHQISGGQRQRVTLTCALACALARRPEVLLLHEPLAAPDIKLRDATQFELMRIQQCTDATFDVVTHDREAAMTLADRLAVMDKGRVMQVGSPTEIHAYPAGRPVARFIGSITTFDARVLRPTGDPAAVDVPALGGTFAAWPWAAAGGPPRAWAGLQRPRPPSGDQGGSGAFPVPFRRNTRRERTGTIDCGG